MTDKQFAIRFTLEDLGKGLVCSPVLLVLIASALCLPWNGSNAPAWVQPIGAVLAIISAVWLALLQPRSQRNVLKTQNVEFANKLSILLKGFFVEAIRASQTHDDPTSLVNQSIFIDIKYGNRVVQGVDPISVPTAELMSKWFAIKDVLQAIERNFEIFMHSSPKTLLEGGAKELKLHALRVNSNKFFKAVV
ncbi:hypothetical protein BFW86_14625 [Pseudomonas fluorescens]|nr:hypothetical protein BFW86_14625 [Pseudomonas fluorescens]